MKLPIFPLPGAAAFATITPLPESAESKYQTFGPRLRLGVLSFLPPSGGAVEYAKDEKPTRLPRSGSVFPPTANSSVSQAGKKHLNSHKTGKRKRHLRGSVIETGKLGKKYVEIMGGAN